MVAAGLCFDTNAVGPPNIFDKLTMLLSTHDKLVTQGGCRTMHHWHCDKKILPPPHYPNTEATHWLCSCQSMPMSLPGTQQSSHQ
jgi:hypothetical protein